MAVKRIRVIDGYAADIAREMEMVSNLAHKHIIQCYGVDRDANYVSIITDYAEGGNLRAATPRLNWEDKKRIVMEVALGLAYLHGQGIVHRDIKGANILLTEHNEAKLCDFGITKVIASATCASSFVRKGTPGFMAPELMKARPTYSTMSDVYALGVVMQELIHGDSTPDDYRAVMNRCLDEDPEKRPKADEIAGAFHIDLVHGVNAEDNQEEFLLEFRPSSRHEVDTEGAESLWISANQGDTEAQNLMGDIYRLGIGVLPDYTKAAKWYQMAADKGDAESQVELAKLYLDGSDLPEDSSRALDLLQAAAEQGHDEACIILGEIYVTGNFGVALDNATGMRWFREAAERGDSKAQVHLGMMFYHGKGVEQDYVESRKFLLMAADQGHLEANRYLGEMYHLGLGGPQDHHEALERSLKAAKEGDMTAQYNVGIFYINGYRDVPKNPSRGTMWLKKAAEQGHEGSQTLVEVFRQMWSS
ncbi:hypothetical protein BGZ58_010008 [Dissophora ornata]|nr:hypothetical protein BGZ58_010008 [Dissophora ornata]